MYRFILFYFVLFICIYVAPWSCEARHLVPLYVHTCSGMTIKLNLNLNLNLLSSVFRQGRLALRANFWFILCSFRQGRLALRANFWFILCSVQAGKI